MLLKFTPWEWNTGFRIFDADCPYYVHRLFMFIPFWFLPYNL